MSGSDAEDVLVAPARNLVEEIAEGHRAMEVAAGRAVPQAPAAGWTPWSHTLRDPRNPTHLISGGAAQPAAAGKGGQVKPLPAAGAVPGRHHRHGRRRVRRALGLAGPDAPSGEADR
jgi:hypothetical protein